MSSESSSRSARIVALGGQACFVRSVDGGYAAECHHVAPSAGYIGKTRVTIDDASRDLRRHHKAGCHRGF